MGNRLRGVELLVSLIVRASVFGVVQGCGLLAAVLALLLGGGAPIIVGVLIVSAAGGVVLGDRLVRPWGSVGPAVGPSPAGAPTRR